MADIGPGALIELHQHMVRSPPPTTWPRIPIFKYEEKDQIQVSILVFPSKYYINNILIQYKYLQLF